MFRLFCPVPLAANAVLRKIGIFMAFLCGYFDFLLYIMLFSFIKSVIVPKCYLFCSIKSCMIVDVLLVIVL
jgi:hypothetical protein